MTLYHGVPRTELKCQVFNRKVLRLKQWPFKAGFKHSSGSSPISLMLIRQALSIASRLREVNRAYFNRTRGSKIINRKWWMGSHYISPLRVELLITSQTGFYFKWTIIFSSGIPSKEFFSGLWTRQLASARGRSSDRELRGEYHSFYYWLLTPRFSAPNITEQTLVSLLGTIPFLSTPSVVNGGRKAPNSAMRLHQPLELKVIGKLRWICHHRLVTL